LFGDEIEEETASCGNDDSHLPSFGTYAWIELDKGVWNEKNQKHLQM